MAPETISALNFLNMCFLYELHIFAWYDVKTIQRLSRNFFLAKISFTGAIYDLALPKNLVYNKVQEKS